MALKDTCNSDTPLIFQASLDTVKLKNIENRMLVTISSYCHHSLFLVQLLSHLGEKTQILQHIKQSQMIFKINKKYVLSKLTCSESFDKYP